MLLNQPQIKSSNGIPILGFGTYGLRGGNCTESVTDALALGYRHIDTAQFYDNEAEVGKGIRRSTVPRELIFLVTKIWPSRFHEVEKAAEESLRDLQVDQLDLLLLHWPSDEQSNARALDALFKVKSEGKVKNIGISNFSTPQCEDALLRAPVICNQVEYHPLINKIKMRDYCASHHLTLVAYSPLAKGKANHIKLLNEIAMHYNKTPSQVALRWLIQQGNIAVIPKTGSSERRLENMNIFDFELTEEDMGKIFDLTGS